MKKKSLTPFHIYIIYIEREREMFNVTEMAVVNNKM